MLLVLDIGNTNGVLGLWEGDDLRASWRFISTNYRTSDELGVFFTMLLQQSGKDMKAVEGCCISSVVPHVNRALEQMSRTVFGVEPLMVGPGIKTGLVLQSENPKEVGADRIVNGVGAIEEYEGPLVVIDFGTATTFDFITAKHEYRGGIIMPGIQLSADALFEKCAKLPRVDIATPPNVVGRDTVSSIRSGLTYGYADMVDGLVSRIADETDTTPTVIATGGLAPVIADIAKKIDRVDPQLTLKGLKILYDKNQGR